MRFQPPLVLISLVLGGISLVTGCNATGSVQDVISAEVDPPQWYLSPTGDKLIYNTRAEPEHAIVRFLTTDQDVTIDNCPWFSWLDNETIYCYEYQVSRDIPAGIIGPISADTIPFSRTSIERITPGQAQLDALLEEAITVYRLQLFSEIDSLLIKKSDNNAESYYHINPIKDLDGILQKYSGKTTVLSHNFADSTAKIYSPNKKYYYILNNSLKIYDEATDQLLAEFEPKYNYISYFQIPSFYPANSSIGWAADSSGVFFQIYHSSGFGPRPPIRPVQKLCVPGASSCSTAN